MEGGFQSTYWCRFEEPDCKVELCAVRSTHLICVDTSPNLLMEEPILFRKVVISTPIACGHNLKGMLHRSQKSGGVYVPMSLIKAPSKSCQKHMYVNTFLGALLPGHPGKAIRIHPQGILKGRYCGKPYPGHRPPLRPSTGPTVLDPGDGPDSSPSPRLDTRLPPPGEHGEDFLATTSGPPDSSPPPPPSNTLVKTMVKTLVNFRRFFKDSRN